VRSGALARKDGDLSRFVGWLTLTHTQALARASRLRGGRASLSRAFQVVRRPIGRAFVYSLPHVERNPLRANLVGRAEDWRWSSLWRLTCGTPEERAVLADWPEPRPSDWLTYVNSTETEAELAAVRRSIQRVARLECQTESTSSAWAGIPTREVAVGPRRGMTQSRKSRVSRDCVMLRLGQKRSRGLAEPQSRMPGESMTTESGCPAVAKITIEFFVESFGAR